MKAHLLYRDRDFDWKWALQAASAPEAYRIKQRYHGEEFNRHSGLPWNAEALIQDLELDTLFTAMAREDGYVFEVARKEILTGSQNDIETIRYRQNILQDCLKHPEIVRELYAIAAEAMEEKSKNYLHSFLTSRPDSVLRWSIETLEALLGSIKKLRKLADAHADKFISEGWTAFFTMVRSDLSEDYIALVKSHLARLRFRNGILLGAHLGKGNKGTGHTLLWPPRREEAWLAPLLRPWLPWLFAHQPPACGFSLHPRDEAGFRMLEDIKNRGIAIAANVLGQSADHVRDFFSLLRTELAFYVGSLNLHEQLASKGEPLCLPSPGPVEKHELSFGGLYDVCLSLNLSQRVVSNDAKADGKDFIIVTGANQGGKSTFLRSVGLAQLMMQSGMFVPAEFFRSSICDGLFTHYKREEDTGMKSGKFDEELSRMSDIVDHVTPHPLILFNESFAATNEREGSGIARQITAALFERGCRMVFVTHLYEYARDVCENDAGRVLFLRADRQANGARSFKLVEGRPLSTSFGEDIYNKIFCDD